MSAICYYRRYGTLDCVWLVGYSIREEASFVFWASVWDSMKLLCTSFLLWWAIPAAGSDVDRWMDQSVIRLEPCVSVPNVDHRSSHAIFERNELRAGVHTNSNRYTTHVCPWVRSPSFVYAFLVKPGRWVLTTSMKYTSNIKSGLTNQQLKGLSYTMVDIGPRAVCPMPSAPTPLHQIVESAD